jgi:uncharacterized protein (DUF1800 family)
MCVRHPLHASFFVEKLWSYFIPVPPSADERRALEAAYVGSGWSVRPVLEAILLHPQLHAGPSMVKPPIVFLAGLLRALRRAVDTEAWIWLSDHAGQRLFMPPDVSGWDAARWLDTSTVRGRWEYVTYALRGREIQGDSFDEYDPAETPEQALGAARAAWGDPSLTTETAAALTAFAASCVTPDMPMWKQRSYRALRQNALRQLVACSPDLQVA